MDWSNELHWTHIDTMREASETSNERTAADHTNVNAIGEVRAMALIHMHRITGWTHADIIREQ